MADSPLLIVGSILFALIFGIWVLRLSFFRGKIDKFLKNVGDRFTQTYDIFECAIYAKNKRDRDPQKILNLAANCDAWRDIERGLEKWYKFNKYHEKIDGIGMAMSTVVIILYFIPLNSYSIFGVIFLFIYFIFISIIIFTMIQSYHRIDKMEDNLGIGKSIH